MCVCVCACVVCVCVRVLCAFVSSSSCVCLCAITLFYPLYPWLHARLVGGQIKSVQWSPLLVLSLYMYTVCVHLCVMK